MSLSAVVGDDTLQKAALAVTQKAFGMSGVRGESV